MNPQSATESGLHVHFCDFFQQNACLNAETESTTIPMEYVVEAIQDRGYMAGEPVFLTSWRGYDDEDTWESAANLAVCGPHLFVKLRFFLF